MNATTASLYSALFASLVYVYLFEAYKDDYTRTQRAQYSIMTFAAAFLAVYYGFNTKRGQSQQGNILTEPY